MFLAIEKSLYDPEFITNRSEENLIWRKDKWEIKVKDIAIKCISGERLNWNIVYIFPLMFLKICMTIESKSYNIILWVFNVCGCNIFDNKVKEGG